MKSDPQIGTSNVGSGRPVLVATLLVNLTISFMTSSLNVSLPVMNREFQASAVSLTWVATAYVLAIAVFSVPFSRIADIIGRKKVFLGGAIIFTIISAITMFSQSIIMIIGCRSIQGISSAMMQGIATAMLTAAYPANQRGRVLGISAGTIFFGQSIGPFIGGLLTEYLGWRSIFGVSVLTGLTVLTITIWKVKADWIEAKGAKFDYKGTTIYCLALVALIYGFSLIPNTTGIILAVIGIMGLLAFIKWESKEPSPILDVNTFRYNRVFILSNIATFILYCANFAVMFLLSLYLQYVKGFTAEIAGLILLSQPLTQAILSPLTGKLSDRIEPRIVASIGVGLTLIGEFALIFLTSSSPVIQICAILIVLGFGGAFFTSPNTNSIMSSVTPKHYAIAASLANTTRTLGNTISLSITMIVFSLVIGEVSLTPEYATSFLTSIRIIFTIFSVLCLIGIFASLARGVRSVDAGRESK
jgi:EmrB/QacA subfamily drug resistance transporter